MSNFFHSHVHSEHSLLDGLTNVRAAAEKAAALGHPALALTDHGTMSGIVEHYQACRKVGIVPVLGVEAYVVPSASQYPLLAKERADRKNAAARAQGERKQVTSVATEAAKIRKHCLLLVRNFEGYKHLVQRVTQSYRQMYFKPVIDHSDLADLAAGGNCWLTTGCVSAEIPQLWRHQSEEAARQLCGYYASIFQGRFAVELMHHGLQDVDEEGLNRFLVRLAHEFSLPLICSQDVHYLDASDRPYHDFFKEVAYQTGGSKVAGFQGAHDLCVEDSLRHRLPDYFDECLSGITYLLRDVSDISFPDLDSYSYAVPRITPKNPMSVLICLTRSKLEELGPEYFERWQTEMRVIRDTGFAQYFLFVRMIVKYCEDNDIFVIARGSASGSLVCYLLGITQVDPLQYGLLFERFLSNDRSKPPDIDLDVEDHRRDEVLSYIGQRYETTQIGTIGTFADKSIKNEVLAALKRRGEILEGTEVEDLSSIPSAKAYLDKFTGLKKSMGGHPAGIIAETQGKSVAEIVPLMKIGSSGRWVTQYDMDTIESLGFVKVDVLGVRSLRTVRICSRLLGKDGWDWIPDSDPDTWKLLASGKTSGIFTFKGWSAKKGCESLKPKSIEDCALVAAIWRPSCLDEGLEQLFLERRAERWKPPKDWHPVLKEALSETFGIPVYQEQVIRVMRGLGFTPDDVMVMLRAVKKKDAKLMATVHQRLHEVAPEIEDELWKLMEGYTRYGFNKSHAVVYGLFGYKMAYLKAHHPLEFMCAVLQTEDEKTMQTLYTREAKKLGLKVLRASVDRSKATWALEGPHLRQGLTNVLGVSQKGSEALVAARPFTSLEDLYTRIPKSVCGRGDLKKLAQTRALSCLGVEDSEDLEYQLDQIDAFRKEAARLAKARQKAGV